MCNYALHMVNNSQILLIISHDLQKYKSNAHVKPNKIIVKTERAVEESLGIKREIINTTPNKASPNTAFLTDKNELIAKIVELKSENQKYLLDLQKSKDEVNAMAAANKELQQKVNLCEETHLDKISSLQSELSKSNDMIAGLKTNNEKRIAELTHEKDLAQAKFKQLLNTFDQQNQKDEESDDNFYEVECLLRDKMVQKRSYLVRWKGFDSSHDSWILESDLQCPDILKKYKQLNGKK